jgi:hypothetical protein
VSRVCTPLRALSRRSVDKCVDIHLARNVSLAKAQVCVSGMTVMTNVRRLVTVGALIVGLGALLSIGIVQDTVDLTLSEVRGIDDAKHKTPPSLSPRSEFASRDLQFERTSF